MSDKEKTVKQKNKRLTMRLVMLAVFMFGFCYMLVPLYSLVCKHLGINGRSFNNHPMKLPAGIHVDTSRTIDVEFSTAVHGALKFDFRPLIHHIKIHPGETKLVYFYAQNETGHPITVQAIPSITPDEDAKYFTKTQCFCFTQQYFFKNERADMPVYFYINPEIDKDVTSMSLAYTMFDVTHFIKKGQKYYRRGRIDIK